MKVSVAELNKNGVEHYLELVGDEAIVITKGGKQLATITPANKSFADFIRSHRGILPETATLEEAREERMAKHERHY